MLRKIVYRSSFVVLTLFALSIANSSAQNLTVREIMAEPSIAGMRADGEKISPDGSKVIFLWNAEGKMPRDLYLVSTSGGTPQKILSPSDLPPPSRPPEKENKLDYGLIVRDEFVKSRENALGNFEWSPDSKRLVFSYGGDLYVLAIGEQKPRRFTKTQTPETGARFLDDDRILFSQSGHLFVWDLASSLLTQVSKESNPASFVSVFNATPNKPGNLIAYVVSDSAKNKALVVPNYLDEFTAAPSVRRGWTEQKVLVTPADGSRDTPFEIKLPKPEGVSSIRRMVWASDNSSLIIDRIDKDTKRRQLFYVHDVGSKSEKIVLVTEETDDKWQASLSSIFEPNPKDPSEIFFGSERDGFNHLYLAKLETAPLDPAAGTQRRGEVAAAASVAGDREHVATGGGATPTGRVTIRQLTNGDWQVEWAKWTNGGHIVYSSTEKGPQGRSVYRIEPNLTVPPHWFVLDAKDQFPGMKGGFQLSETGSPQTLLFEYSQWNLPGELYSVPVHVTSEKPTRLTTTVPESFSRRSWTPPRFIDIPSRDGKKIPAKIYLPPNFSDKGKQKYPMAIFVHGAGYLQNVINGWNNYYREFMFNDLLAKKGYVVLDIDYRGSAGYGRDWRTDVYDFLGGKDYDDHIDAIDHMVANYNVNPAKVGAYGGSYGGFMAGMLAMRAPDKIAAAAALRPVFDWKNYFAANPGYTAQRLGFPDKNPEAYRRSSPISYADKLERPLLILHGMSDDNVHVQDSIQLMEKLIRLGKTRYFEVMLYPSENHGFARPESWADEYERILAFFEKHLK